MNVTVHLSPKCSLWILYIFTFDLIVVLPSVHARKYDFPHYPRRVCRITWPFVTYWIFMSFNTKIDQRSIPLVMTISSYVRSGSLDAYDLMTIRLFPLDFFPHTRTDNIEHRSRVIFGPLGWHHSSRERAIPAAWRYLSMLMNDSTYTFSLPPLSHRSAPLSRRYNWRLRVKMSSDMPAACSRV